MRKSKKEKIKNGEFRMKNGEIKVESFTEIITFDLATQPGYLYRRSYLEKLKRGKFISFRKTQDQW